MKLPNAEQESRPWRIHDLVPDFVLEDVWALPVEGGADDFQDLLGLAGSFDPSTAASGPTRFLWNLRDRLGRWLDLGEIASPVEAGAAGQLPIPGASEVSVRERLPSDLRGSAGALTFGSLPFVPLYRTDREAAAEISNKTVHGVAHFSWVERGDGAYQGRMAVYVKPRGAFGRAYMALIKPFRHWVVYPALMRQMERAWAERGVLGEEWKDEERVGRYLGRADEFPHRAEGESVLLEHVPRDVRRVLDLGTGDGRLLALLRADRPEMRGVGVDLSEPMLAAARERFAGAERVELIEHDLAEPLPALGRFDAVVSSMAIHHLEHERKRELYGEVLDLLEPGGIFANFEHVASPTQRLHEAFFAAIGEPLENEDPSDRLLDVETQLGWLREHRFEHVECYWKVARDGAADRHQASRRQQRVAVKGAMRGPRPVQPHRSLGTSSLQISVFSRNTTCVS